MDGWVGWRTCSFEEWLEDIVEEEVLEKGEVLEKRLSMLKTVVSLLGVEAMDSMMRCRGILSQYSSLGDIMTQRVNS